MKHLSLPEAGIVLLELALVAALAASLAHWTWVAATPRATAAPSLTEPAARGGGAVAMRQLFGSAQEGARQAASAGGGLALIGVFSERRPDAGRAIFARQGGKPVAVAVGESIEEGLELREVHADHVIVMRDGARQRIDLERRTVSATPPVAAQPVSRMPVRK